MGDSVDDSKKVRVLNPEYEPAGFWIRVVGAVLDAIFFQIATFFLFALFWVAGMQPPDVIMRIGIGGLYTLMIIYFAIYLSLSWSIFSTTLGKKVLGLVPIDADSKKTVGVARGLLREIPAKFISAIPLDIGFIMVGLRKDKRGLHDLIARTQVVRRRKID